MRRPEFIGAAGGAAILSVCRPADGGLSIACKAGKGRPSCRRGTHQIPAGEARLRKVIMESGFKRVRRAAETPFNMVLEARL